VLEVKVEGLDAAAGVASFPLFLLLLLCFLYLFVVMFCNLWTMNVGLQRVRAIEAELLKKSTLLHVLIKPVVLGISASSTICHSKHIDNIE